MCSSGPLVAAMAGQHCCEVLPQALPGKQGMRWLCCVTVPGLGVISSLSVPGLCSCICKVGWDGSWWLCEGWFVALLKPLLPAGPLRVTPGARPGAFPEGTRRTDTFPWAFFGPGAKMSCGIKPAISRWRPDDLLSFPLQNGSPVNTRSRPRRR